MSVVSVTSVVSVLSPQLASCSAQMSSSSSTVAGGSPRFTPALAAPAAHLHSQPATSTAQVEPSPALQLVSMGMGGSDVAHSESFSTQSASSASLLSSSPGGKLPVIGPPSAQKHL